MRADSDLDDPATAAKHAIHVDETRDQWFDFWQRAQDAMDAAARKQDEREKQEEVLRVIDEKGQVEMPDKTFDNPTLRDLHDRLEMSARRAINLATV